MSISPILPRRWRAGLAVLLLSMASVALAQPQPQPETASPQAVAARHIGNFGKVNDTYYRGDQPKGDDYLALASLGVRTVIDLRNDFEPDEQKLVESAGMKYNRIPLSASRNPTEAEVRHFLELVNDPANQPVYVHCKAGRHRTGVMTAMYRLTKDGWTADQAYREMKEYRFKVTLNFLFGHENLKDFVYDYYETLQQAAAATASGRGGS